MSRRLLILLPVAMGFVIATGAAAYASDVTGGQGGSRAGAGTGPGSVTVGVGIYRLRQLIPRRVIRRR